MINILKTSKCKMYFDRAISLLGYKPLHIQACLKPLTKTYKLTAYKQQFGVLFNPLSPKCDQNQFSPQKNQYIIQQKG